MLKLTLHDIHNRGSGIARVLEAVIDAAGVPRINRWP